MTSHPQDPPSHSTGLQSMLARLRGMAPPPPQPATDPQGIPLATPVNPEDSPLAVPVAEPVAEAVPVAASVPAAQELCPHCQAPRATAHDYCDNCGWIFKSEGPTVAERPPAAPLLQGRYELGKLVSRRGEVCRFRGRAHEPGSADPVAVTIVRMPLALAAAEVLPEEEVPDAAGAADAAEDIVPSFDDALTAEPALGETPSMAFPWPSVAWERDLLERTQHGALPRMIDNFVADDHEYLVEEVPVGQPLWDAWDDPEAAAPQRFAWLRQLAQALHELHAGGAVLEALRPDNIVLESEGQARLIDLADLLPLPLPPAAPVRATHYTAPELVFSPEQADARADLYSFGALLYALHVRRELSDMDFEKPGVPKPFIPQFPDAHPALARLVTKTFCHDVQQRFPTDEARKEDLSGFPELMRTLAHCGRTLDQVRLEIGAWTTPGMVRTGNEDAFALLHGIEARQDDLEDAALVLLADGMGGYEAGEVAAALAIQTLRKSLLQQKFFAGFSQDGMFSPAGADRLHPAADLVDVEVCKLAFTVALKEANRLVYQASRSDKGRRGMGCTAEAVYVNDRFVVVGHVGDSRTYHIRQGQLVQLTRDQTLVNRLVELGTLTQAEAEKHPRRSELQQAIGGQPDVLPAMYHAPLKPGDWVVVCSDGLSNHVLPETLQEMLETAASAETAARRFVNLVNLEGATDNATVVVIRAT